MGVKQFPADFADITSQATKVLAAKADGVMGFAMIPYVYANGESVFAGRMKIQNNINGENAFNFLNTDTGPLSYSIFQISNGSNAFQIFKTGSGFANTGPYKQSGSVINETGAGGLTLSADAGLFLCPSGGLVGIGTQSPTQKLHVIGNILASGSITPGSDKRLKKCIKNLPDSLTGILGLRPVSYTLREDDAKAMGFVADEVREIFPDLVLEGKDDEKMLAMNYMGLTAPIVKAIQELHQKHIELENKYNSLLARVEALENK